MVRWQELSRSECFELLGQEHLGRVAVVDDWGPALFPVNFVLDRHTVVLRTDEGPSWMLRSGAAGSLSRSTGPTRRLTPAGA